MLLNTEQVYFDNIIIYLRCSSEIALQRIQKRGRIEEKEISIEYLNNLNKYHEEWLIGNNKQNIIVIDCNIDFENDIDYQNQIINNVLESITKIKNMKNNNS